MKPLPTILFLLLMAFTALAESAATSLSDETLAGIKFDQKLNQQISPDLQFQDENGKTVRLGDYFKQRPVILVLGYSGCPMLCSLTLNGLIEAMQDLKMDVGNQFDVLNVSIDPKETPAVAAATKQVYLKRYGRHGAAEGWHFLTGDEPSIHKLADEAGFHYAYDPLSKEYAHPSGLIILTPDAKIAHYLFGVTYSGKDLDAALRGAGAHKIGSPIGQFFLLCFHYSPLTGKYGNLIMAAVRISGVVTLLAVVGVIFRSRPPTGVSRQRPQMLRLRVPSPLNGERVRVRGEQAIRNSTRMPPPDTATHRMEVGE